MTTSTLIVRSLRFHARAHLGALLGATVGSAVLIGALVVGDSVQVEIRSGMRRIQSTAMVRNVTPHGAGLEFVHLKPGDRELLRRLVSQLLK